MPVVAIVNRKGGSGKSTIATHLAAYCAHRGIGVMLGDVDRQQSTRSWLRLRELRHPPTMPIVGWAVAQGAALRVPAGVSHVVLDTPGGLHGLDLARVVMFADAIIMPICNAVFDRESAAQCFEELRILPRIASGRCKLACVGMRVDERSLDSAMLAAWASQRRLPYLGGLHDAPCYIQCAEQGITIFDLPRESVSVDVLQWAPIVQWLEPVLFPASVDVAPLSSNPSPALLRAEVPAVLQPLLGDLPLRHTASPLPVETAHGVLPAKVHRHFAPALPVALPAAARGATTYNTTGKNNKLLNSVIPSFLRRKSSAETNAAGLENP